MAAIHVHAPLDAGQQLQLMQEDARFDVADNDAMDNSCIPDPSIFADISSRPAPPRFPKFFSPITAFLTAPTAAAAAATKNAVATVPNPVNWRNWL